MKGETKTYVMAKICGDANENFYVFAEGYYCPLNGVFYKDIFTDTKMAVGSYKNDSDSSSFDDSLLIYNVKRVSYNQLVRIVKFMSGEDIQLYQNHVKYMKQLSDGCRRQAKEGNNFVSSLK